MIGRAFKVVFGRSRVHNVDYTTVSTGGRCYLYRAVVGREASLPLVIDLPVYGTACTRSGHTC